MQNPLIPFDGNANAGIVRQARYRITYENGNHVVSIVIETADGIRSYPSTDQHPVLVEMVNAVKAATNGAPGGQFYINEWRQVIVPAGSPEVKYYYAGTYANDIILGLHGEEFSGRPHDNEGNLLKPGDSWDGRPRPGIKYTLKAGGADIEYVVPIKPGVEKVVRLSKVIGPQPARQAARKIAQVKGNSGGAFFINEYRAIFAPVAGEDGYSFKFVGILDEATPWFPMWQPDVGSTTNVPAGIANVEPPTADAPNPSASRSGASVIEVSEFVAKERSIDIAEGETGHSYETLFKAYLSNATEITLEDSHMGNSHQLANFLRFCELIVSIGKAKQVNLLTKVITNDGLKRVEKMRRSLLGYGITLTVKIDTTVHDRQIMTDDGWNINLGRGLDIYKRPEDWDAIGVSDFSLRPCYKTTIVFHRFAAEQQKMQA